MKKIIKINIEDAEAGMQLATDAVDAQGVRLLSIGNTLNNGSISGLKKRNIKEISIYKLESLTADQADNMKISIKNELDNSFRFLSDYPVLNELKQVFYDFRIKDITINNE